MGEQKSNAMPTPAFMKGQAVAIVERSSDRAVVVTTIAAIGKTSVRVSYPGHVGEGTFSLVGDGYDHRTHSGRPASTYRIRPVREGDSEAAECDRIAWFLYRMGLSHGPGARFRDLSLRTLRLVEAAILADPAFKQKGCG